MNEIFTFIFIAELGLKLISLGVIGYLRDKMNIFDGAIVTFSIFELIFFTNTNKAVSAFRAVRIFKIFRTFRVLRVSRLLRGLAFMVKIIEVISDNLDSFVYVALLLLLFCFIYALLGMQVYSGKLTKFNDGDFRFNFDNF